jgi:hypothetical protein
MNKRDLLSSFCCFIFIFLNKKKKNINEYYSRFKKKINVKLNYDLKKERGGRRRKVFFFL